MSARSPALSRWLRWGCVLWVAATAYVVITSDYAGWRVLIALCVAFMPALAVLAALLWAAVPVAALAAAVDRLRAREPRAAAGWLLTPAFAVLMATAVVAFDSPVRHLGDVVMFRITNRLMTASSGRCPSDTVGMRTGPHGEESRRWTWSAVGR